MSGGSWFRTRRLVTSATLVRHPKGNVLFDTGLGREARKQVGTYFPLWAKLLLEPTYWKDTSSLLTCSGDMPSSIARIIPSHLHWDHASGIKDFPEAEVWATPAEREFGARTGPPIILSTQFDGPNVRWKAITFPDGPYEGFEASQDVYGDKALILVSLPGHTPGSVGLFVNPPGGRRLFLIGDNAWVIEGVTNLKGKYGIAQWLVSEDDKPTLMSLTSVADVLKRNPDLIIVTAHDPEGHKAAGSVVSDCSE